DRSVSHLALAFRRADLDAESAARAVFGRDLQGVARLAEFAPLRWGRLETGGRLGEDGRRIHLGADDGVRADEHALAALDAERLVPGRDLERDVAFFPARGTARIGPVG